MHTGNAIWGTDGVLYVIDARVKPNYKQFNLTGYLDEFKVESAINTESKQGERFSISDNPFVTERKAKSAANIFKALTLDELDSDVVDYLENKTPLYAELGGFVCLKMNIR